MLTAKALVATGQVKLKTEDGHDGGVGGRTTRFTLPR